MTGDVSCADLPRQAAVAAETVERPGRDIVAGIGDEDVVGTGMHRHAVGDRLLQYGSIHQLTTDDRATAYVDYCRCRDAAVEDKVPLVADDVERVALERHAPHRNVERGDISRLWIDAAE